MGQLCVLSRGAECNNGSCSFGKTGSLARFGANECRVHSKPRPLNLLSGLQGTDLSQDATEPEKLKTVVKDIPKP